EATWSAARTYAVVMTHRHDLDEAIIGQIVQQPARYVGLIGSETKWRRLRERLAARGTPAQALDRVRCPIGVPVGGKLPQEIAVSIAAELLATHHAGDARVRDGDARAGREDTGDGRAVARARGSPADRDALDAVQR
ncbi:MAG TPA: XdhC family protein, partial [Polyangiaceae bacterium]|nr:XdhC family protein [Polyangiaceae bacterium]